MTELVRILASSAVLLALGAPAWAKLPVPRKSPELSIIAPSGKHTLLSSFKGKVVLIEFLWTNCPHCVRASRTIARLHQELGPRGFQAIGIAFNEGVTGPMVAGLAQQSGATFPFGYSSPEAVDNFLGRSLMERFMVPQIVVIDRHGVIRAQSLPQREQNLEDESYLRNLIGSLLDQAP